MLLVPLAESLHQSHQFCLQENLLNLFYQYSKPVWVDLRKKGEQVLFSALSRQYKCYIY